MSDVALLLSILFQILTFAIFVRVIMSWFIMNPSSRTGFSASVYQVLLIITEPILAPLRRIIPMFGMFDFTPLIAIVILQIIGEVLLRASS